MSNPKTFKFLQKNEPEFTFVGTSELFQYMLEQRRRFIELQRIETMLGSGESMSHNSAFNLIFGSNERV